jgi:hypothetical protein
VVVVKPAEWVITMQQSPVPHHHNFVLYGETPLLCCWGCYSCCLIPKESSEAVFLERLLISQELFTLIAYECYR